MLNSRDMLLKPFADSITAAVCLKAGSELAKFWEFHNAINTLKDKNIFTSQHLEEYNHHRFIHRTSALYAVTLGLLAFQVISDNPFAVMATAAAWTFTHIVIHNNIENLKSALQPFISLNIEYDRNITCKSLFNKVIFGTVNHFNSYINSERAVAARS